MACRVIVLYSTIFTSDCWACFAPKVEFVRYTNSWLYWNALGFNVVLMRDRH